MPTEVNNADFSVGLTHCLEVDEEKAEVITES